MRLFTGLSLTYEVRRNIELLYQSLQPLAAVDWTPPGNLHITTKFIGEWPEERLDELKAALRGMAKPAPFPVSIDGFGWFPTPHHPRHLFAAVRAPEGLAALAAATEAAMISRGVAAESKPYRPHVTLAKIKEAKIKDATLDLAPVKQFIAQLPSTDFGRMTVNSFKLYASRNSLYSVLEDYPL
ncbi:MAG: RNA 2',3'-cyclic phosphodiesterase [Bryobacteraceae bacterium]|nr:RNA 2',3'-cyclic phosphodiesterase [Bryobacteraceae bacterium]